MTEDAKPADLRNFCIMLYGIYAVSIVLGGMGPTVLIVLLGLLLVIIAYILMRSKREAAKDTPFASHLRWMNRTFWIGTGIIFPMALIISSFLIWTFTDLASVTDSLMQGDPDAMMGTIQSYVENSQTKAFMIGIVTMLPAVIWWLHRCWIGYTLARDGKPVENVTSWL